MIRKAKFEDRETVLRLAKELAASFEVETAAFENSWDKLLASPDDVIFVSENQGEIQGYLLGLSHSTFFANGSVAVAEELMVHESQRLKGLGKALMVEFEAWAKSKGCRLAAVVTRRAAKFYQSVGYEESASYLRKLL